MTPLPKRLKLPVRLVDGRWEFYFGGAIPVQDGAYAEIVVDTSAITDKDFVQRVTQKLVTKCLSQGNRLMVAVTVREPPFHAVLYRPNGETARRIKVRSGDLPSVSTMFVPVTLGGPDRKKSAGLLPDEGGLWLTVTGFGECELSSSTVLFPEELDIEPAQSLNHAFTKLSERFETHRLSHTGSVYSRVFYLESNGCWYPLESLKNAALVRTEHSVMAASWKVIEEQLGWCRLPPHEPPKSGSDSGLLDASE
jgi:hypothetical protein